MDRAPYVAVIGSAEVDHATADIAEEVGRLLGERGAVLLCGGLGGVMEAACRGARSSGGTTIGILPGWDRSDANPHVDVALPTGMGEMRNALIARAADALIAVGGEFGSLSEIAFALKIGRPVVGIETWELHRGGEVVGAIHVAASPQDAVDLALTTGRSAGI